MAILEGQDSSGQPRPVPVSTDGLTVPVSGNVSVTGGATSAKQDTGNNSLSSIDGKLPAATAPADDESSAGTVSRIAAVLMSYSGSARELVRSGLVAVQTTFKGILNVIPLSRFLANPTARATGNVGPLQSDELGSLFINGSIRYATALAASPCAITGGPVAGVAVDTDSSTITGELADNPGVSYTTPALSVGLLYPFAFNKITAISGGTGHTFWYRKPG